MAVDLDTALQQIHDLSGEVDNVYTDVRYRAPMAGLAYLATQLVIELRDTQNARETAIATVARWERAYQEQAAKHEAERAELCAAREVITHARIHVSKWDRQARDALAAYDKVTGEGS